MAALFNLALSSESCEEIKLQNGIQTVSKCLLQEDQLELQLHAAGVIMNCAAQDDDARLQARSYGTVRPLLKLLASQRDTVRGRAAATLFNLCLNDNICVDVRQSDGLKILVGLLDTMVAVSVRVDVMGIIAACLHVDPEARQAMLQLNAIPFIIAMLSSAEDVKLTRRAASALLFAAKNELVRVAILLSDGLPPLVAALGSQDSETVANAAGALFECAGNAEAAIAIRMCGGIAAIVKALQTRDASEYLLANASGALMNIVAYDEASRSELVTSSGVTTLCSLLHHRSAAVVRNCAGAVFNAASNAAVRQTVCGARVADVLLKQVLHPDEGVQAYVAGCLQLCAVEDEFRTQVVDAEGVDVIVNALQSTDDATLQERLSGALCNLCLSAGAVADVRVVGGLDVILECINSDIDNVRLFAACAVARCAEHSDPFRVDFADHRGVVVLVSLITDTVCCEQALIAIGNLAINKRCALQVRLADALQHLVECLRVDDALIIERAIICVWRIAANDIESRAVLVELSAVPLLADLTRSGYTVTALAALYNIAASAVGARAMGDLIVFALEQLQTNAEQPAQVNAVCLLANCAAYSPDARAVIQQAGALVMFAERLSIAEFQTPCVRALSNCAIDDECAVELRSVSGLFQGLLQAAESITDFPLANAAAACLQNLSANERNQVELLTLGALPLMMELLHHPSPQVVSAAAGVLQNCAACDTCALEIQRLNGVHAMLTLLSSRVASAAAMAAAAGCLFNAARIASVAFSLRPVLAQLIGWLSASTATTEMQANIAGVLGNCAVDSENRNQLRRLGAPKALVALLLSEDVHLQAVTAFAVAQLSDEQVPIVESWNADNHRVSSLAHSGDIHASSKIAQAALCIDVIQGLC
eukprot:TRINITY_DN7158_c0_g2_i1.p1 TRINITY_DN7158_c0_g2~~TRINITY_DN7158_c0_g2_i1.p1  ORF type:complete len:998 (-),score=260.39 TRINITY_DN7158_c0_g2_i1:26-2674(-)